MNRLKAILTEILKNKGMKVIPAIDENTDLRDNLGFDSLDLAELTVRIEKEYNIDVFQDGLITSVSDIIAKLKMQ